MFSKGNSTTAAIRCSFFHCFKVGNITDGCLTIWIALRVGNILFGAKQLCLLGFCSLLVFDQRDLTHLYSSAFPLSVVYYTKQEEGSQVFGLAGWSLLGNQQIKVCQVGGGEGWSTGPVRTQQGSRVQRSCFFYLTCNWAALWEVFNQIHCSILQTAAVLQCELKHCDTFKYQKF